MTACNSKSKEFEAPDRKFKFILPADWEEYDDGEENTYAFSFLLLYYSKRADL